MGKVFDGIDGALVSWISAQPVFFVATAPLAGDGHINVSPRGHECLSILGPHRVGWVDYTGSGVETIAHLRDNGRITLMACAFNGNPRISRIYGRGTVYPKGSPEFDRLESAFPDLPGRRSIIDIAVERVTTSCGYAVPLMDLVDDRDRLLDWAKGKGDDGIAAYWDSKNAVSIDGLPGIGA
jgi:hypothetical protein